MVYVSCRVESKSKLFKFPASFLDYETFLDLSAICEEDPLAESFFRDSQIYPSFDMRLLALVDRHLFLV
jgi:hypothetical protein